MLNPLLVLLVLHELSICFPLRSRLVRLHLLLLILWLLPALWHLRQSSCWCRQGKGKACCVRHPSRPQLLLQSHQLLSQLLHLPLQCLGHWVQYRPVRQHPLLLHQSLLMRQCSRW